MTDPLIEAWRALARSAGDWRSGEDPEPVLEALAMSSALELTDALGRAPREEREALRKLGQRALLQVGGPLLSAAQASSEPASSEPAQASSEQASSEQGSSEQGLENPSSEEDLEALRMCASLARGGLRALGGRSPDAEAGRARPGSPETRILVPPSELRRLLRGQLDGFAAASLALRIRRSPPALAELGTLLALAASGSTGAPGSTGAASRDRPLRLAAASATPVLDPARGAVVGTLPSVGAEAVLFEASGEEPRRLAVSAEDPDPLRLLADELTTEDVREGYWVGRIAEGATRLEAILEIGDRTEPWKLELP